jgi:hypothetical protein
MPIAVAASAVQMFVMWKRPRSTGSFASHSAHVHAGAKTRPRTRLSATTAIVKPAMPIGRSSSAHPRSRQFCASANAVLKRTQIPSDAGCL